MVISGRYGTINESIINLNNINRKLTEHNMLYNVLELPV